MNHSIAGDASVRKIYSHPGKLRLELSSFLAQRDLIFLFIHRDIKIRYKQTLVGITWAIIQPLLTMGVFALVFNRLQVAVSGEIPYALFSYCALVPWTYFTHALTKANDCVVQNGAIITKAAFPRLVLPIAAVLAGLADFLIAFLILLAMMFHYNIAFHFRMLVLPVYLLLTVALTLGLGLWLATLNVKYRDVRNALPFLLQLGLLASPVAYGSHLYPKEFRLFYHLNPMAGLIEGFRWSLLGVGPAPAMDLFINCLMIMVILVSGLYYFRSKEDFFADIV
jgi:lipopolysaccharide transport system permease protein